ncbi:putative cobalt-precorrin-6Y C(5)-methyltransferase CbiE [Paenibacillus larvae subsp. larvae]|uniref:Precorrin-6y C5,15-methyltransferase (Decarboxylating) subunit CbiE n=2 Tax=Paenibacillus larvae TaxID=1464 RepID=A0A1U9YJW7_9BACL|nr:cobalt-precorrin-7 (C(5))-methyltransferase [Paenibacillus larvae]AQT86039.1 precorrin-6y C5,15-methyltransferase (decarboxylating) subunit CbiE [Paenibacillus larvae subsp. pulvifaciens]AQZ45716.1 precorrin-6y C5,15-methyltransferase (decarboxylating) subunit CbiE [Paenibacillus larvae subsp. pulvifaciens]ARF69358.1 precorrin-6y C5,15-methyltransferase (decarboxylating) subunit CbiE [Paenibacillus larvae subsp. pulvifaciens]AVF25509.1 putative cobalt-precorrin-6Y C(5)-methyltransferase CbiE
MIHIVGIGPGKPELMTSAGIILIQNADVIIGSKRQLNEIPHDIPAERKLLPSNLSELETFLLGKTGQDIVLLASGDPLMYGIGNWALKKFPKEQLQIVPGISSIQYLCTRCGIAMNDLYMTSSHGKQPDFEFLLAHPKVAMVTDSKIGPAEIAKEILQRKLNKKLIIGENLSYPDERLHLLKPEQVADHYEMNVVVILDEG